MSNVRKTYVKRSTPSKPNFDCCRACLATDRKMFNMHEYRLVDAFARVSGISMQQDKLPQHLCWCCAALLRRCAAFRARCARAQLCLLSGLMQKDLTLEYVRSIDRVANKLVDLMPSGVKTTDITAQDVKDVTPEQRLNNDNDIDTNNDKSTNNDKNTTEYIKYIYDPNVEIKECKIEIDVDNPSEDVVDVDHPSEDVVDVDHPSEDVVDVDDDPSEDVVDVDHPSEDVVDVDHPSEDVVDVDHPSGNVDADNICEEIGGFIVKDIEEIVKQKVKPVKKVIRQRKKNEGKISEKEKIAEEKRKIATEKRKLAKEKGEEFVDAAKKKPKKPQYRDTREYRIAVSNFESKHNVKVHILTTEEQLKEIETRKKSDKYLGAAFHCEECGRGFQVEAAFRNHRAKHDLSAGDHVCAICNMRCRTNHVLLRHKEMHRTRIECQTCGLICQSRSQAANHFKMHAGRTFHCPYCGMTCRTMSYYLTHVRVAHPTQHAACDMCGEMFIGFHGLRQHKARMHNVYMSVDYKCEVCSTTFISPEALKRHTGAAGDGQHEELSPCQMCGHNLPTEELLKQHTVEHHPKCDDCHQTFLDATSYRTHYKRKHLGEKYDPVKAGAVRRRLPVPGARPKRPKQRTRTYMCEHCGKMQPCQAILLEHVRQHEGVRPHACPSCPKTFCTSAQYKAHVRTHTGARPFQCDHCSLAFTLKPNLERHILNKHLGKGKKVPCELCGRCFTTPSSVRLHVRTVHGGEPWPRRNRKKPAQQKSAESA